jgi:protein-export membrane protein SecD
MYKNLKWRLILVFAVVIIAIVYCYPTLKLASLSSEEKAAMNETELNELKDSAIKLGLDLQGGMHLVMEVDRDEIGDANLREVMGRAETIIRNRVDEFGVAEPIIQTEGEDRIVVQLAGLSDESRAKRLVGQTALLEFKLGKEGDDFRNLLATISENLRDEIRELTADEDMAEFERQLEEIAAETDTTGLREEAGADIDTGRGLLSMITFVPAGIHEDALVYLKDKPIVDRIFERAREENLIPSDVEILWDRDIEQGREGEFQRVYLVNVEASLTGKYIESAKVNWQLQNASPGSPGVSLEFNRLGRSLFSRVTGQNVDRRLAIVLDGKVHSAPNITERIMGSAAITGSFTPEQATDLKIVLEAGALPAPLEIVEERTVGPSLGSDSIRSGVRAAIIGGITVAIFMVIYYNLSGLLAVLALVLNLVIILAVLAGLRGTLTLPGIAGIILTIGMAVDANVLIFERIREELAVEKTVRTAIRDGYSRALVAILDANITTIITAFVLFQFGTGPIKGFAVTLIIGILASMFTAIVVTRTIYDAITGTRKIEKLSI